MLQLLKSTGIQEKIKNVYKKCWNTLLICSLQPKSPHRKRGSKPLHWSPLLLLWYLAHSQSRIPLPAPSSVHVNDWGSHNISHWILLQMEHKCSILMIISPLIGSLFEIFFYYIMMLISHGWYTAIQEIHIVFAHCDLIRSSVQKRKGPPMVLLC